MLIIKIAVNWGRGNNGMGVLGVGAPPQTIPETILVTKALRVSSNLANLHCGGPRPRER